MSTSAIPIVLCGKTEKVGAGVIEGLKPEVEVISFILNIPTGAAIIPALLSSSNPPPLSTSDGFKLSDLGTHNYTNLPPVAVVLGGAYVDDLTAQFRTAVAEAGGSKARKVPWLRVDTSIPTPPLGPEYGKALVGRLKAVLLKMKEEGRFEGEGDDGVYFY